MSDNHRRYCSIYKALTQLFGKRCYGHLACHLRTLALLICGIIGSGKSNLPAIASKIPALTQRQSQIIKFTRWIKNEHILSEVYFLPFASALLASLPEGPLTLVMDGSEVGHGCMALVVGVVYKNRALPLGWLVVKGKKGHLPVTAHLELLEEIARRVLVGREVIFLGDGEFDGVELLERLAELHWTYVCRTAKNARLYESCDDDEAKKMPPEAAEGFSFAELGLRPGDFTEIENVRFTRVGYGPLRAVAMWEEGCKEPLYLVTNLELGEEALWWYKKRFKIETFFSDQKSRGFRLAHSHLSDPKRLARLMIATCLAYIWMVRVGEEVKGHPEWMRQIHRSHRCDLSLFQIGMVWMEHCLSRGCAMPEIASLFEALCSG